ncbi:MAG: iron-containing redox enzyme family protein [Armatimonadota bacterium]|nr:iron-containing redox enzyme family protein [Armatimonadota bacterium]
MSIKNELDAVVAKYDLLGHPFYQAWSAGMLPKEALASYAAEYGAFVQTVPAGWAAHGDVTTSIEEVQHAVLWERFANAVGTTSLCEPRLDATRELVEDCKDLYKSPATALGGLYAFEAQQPKTAKSKLDGLVEHYNDLPEDVKPYFAVHVDDVHEREWIVERLNALPEADQQAAIAACKKVAKGLWDALTEIHAPYCA